MQSYLASFPNNARATIITCVSSFLSYLLYCAPRSPTHWQSLGFCKPSYFIALVEIRHSSKFRNFPSSTQLKTPRVCSTYSCTKSLFTNFQRINGQSGYRPPLIYNPPKNGGPGLCTKRNNSWDLRTCLHSHERNFFLYSFEELTLRTVEGMEKLNIWRTFP